MTNINDLVLENLNVSIGPQYTTKGAVRAHSAIALGMLGGIAGLGKDLMSNHHPTTAALGAGLGVASGLLAGGPLAKLHNQYVADHRNLQTQMERKRKQKG